MADSPTVPAAFAGLVDLAVADLGGRALACSDDFFAGMENLVRAAPAVFDPDAYTDRGKLMDGWESRRKRVPGHDWCIIELGVPGLVRGVDIDTAFFLGNHGPIASVEACEVTEDTSIDDLRERVVWTEIVPAMPLQRGSHNLQAVAVVGTWTHVRLRMYPDGGIARLRVYGEPTPERAGSGEVDVACLDQGGRAVACSDMFFSHMNNLIMPAEAENMGSGWETRRSRPPGDDWNIVQLGAPSRVSRVLLHTRHFKGNFPDTVAVDGLYWPDAPLQALVGEPGWQEIVPRFETRAHAAHERDVTDAGPWTHVRLRIYPDGGVSRMRVYGVPVATTPADSDALLVWLNGLGEADAAAALARCCGAGRWAQSMVAARPFASRAHLYGVAETAWWQLDDADWREAFTHHPRIGSDPAALRRKFAATAGWSENEQAGMESAGADVIDDLAQGNIDYEDRFGYIFIVCASGLSAAEMLARLQTRLPHDPANELRIAAGEQAKVTRLRLEKLEPSP